MRSIIFLYLYQMHVNLIRYSYPFMLNKICLSLSLSNVFSGLPIKSRTIRRIALPGRLLKLVGVLVLVGIICVLLVRETISWKSPDSLALLRACETGMVSMVISSACI